MFVWLFSERPRQLLGYIADGPQDRTSDMRQSWETMNSVSAGEGEKEGEREGERERKREREREKERGRERGREREKAGEIGGR